MGRALRLVNPKKRGTAVASDRVVSTIGQRIRQRRLELGLSQREIAGRGVSYAYVSRIEADTRTPSVKVLRLLAATLGVSVHWLETAIEDPATELAELVLGSLGRPLPRRAGALARAVLAQRRLGA